MHNPLQFNSNESLSPLQGEIPARIGLLKFARDSVDFSAGAKLVDSIYSDNTAPESIKKVVAAEVQPEISIEANLNSTATLEHSLIEDNSTSTSQVDYINYLTEQVKNIHEGKEEV